MCYLIYKLRRGISVVAISMPFLLWSTQVASAETILVDDFDGDLSEWTLFDTTVGQDWGPAITEINGKDELWLASRRPIPAKKMGLVGGVWDAGISDSTYTNGTYRARVRIEGENTRAGISMRVTGALATGFNTYNFEVQPSRLSGRIVIARLEGLGAVDSVLASESIPLDEEIFLQASAIGDQLAFKVWSADETEPAEPQLTWTDSEYPTGTLGLYAYRESGQGGGFVLGGEVSAVFDDLTFTTPTSTARIIPEPATALVLVVAIAFAFVLRQLSRHRSFRTSLAVVSLCLLFNLNARQAASQVSLNLGSFNVSSTDPNAVPKPLQIPAGKYNAYSVTLDFSSVQGDPWSEEAIWAIADGAVGGVHTTVYNDPGTSDSARRDGLPVTLHWSGMLDLPITGATDLSFVPFQTVEFNGVTFVANWANTLLELSYVQPPALPTLTAHLGVVSDPFVPFTIDSFGSEFDTEIAIYSETGKVIRHNDDANGIEQSEIDVYNGLPPGDYVAALAGFNSIFEDDYAVISGTSGGGYNVSLTGHAISGILPADATAFFGFSIAEVTLPGDYNNDGTVDLADYTVWRNNLGANSGTLLNDPTPGVIGTAQYATWKSNFGATLPPPASPSIATVPEPSTSILLTLFALGISYRCHGARRCLTSRFLPANSRRSVHCCKFA
ncbi:hypothetical protein NG895_09055 [Aeoliella sp. ICT_H6.2]|uniref:PEP-CTERM protein-sorting domain-containing protein n=1 Tax=Aeoliella straminimaris TaxID=2954799 RepID=A0A9X2FGU3_9BACT|nr:hypothetical protein [Aeoliella straminimaris]MCO6044056.1 hypothetical protein [Aeoliella straminimaris]